MRVHILRDHHKWNISLWYMNGQGYRSNKPTNKQTAHLCLCSDGMQHVYTFVKLMSLTGV